MTMHIATGSIVDVKSFFLVHLFYFVFKEGVLVKDCEK